MYHLTGHLHSIHPFEVAAVRIHRQARPEAQCRPRPRKGQQLQRVESHPVSADIWEQPLSKDAEVELERPLCIVGL